MDYILILKTTLLAWWWTNFEPLQNFLTKRIKPLIYGKSCNTPKWRAAIAYALSCFKCMAMWITLGATLDPFSAILAAFFAASYDKIFSSFKTFL
jgi:hypothetical protein